MHQSFHLNVSPAFTFPTIWQSSSSAPTLSMPFSHTREANLPSHPAPTVTRATTVIAAPCPSRIVSFSRPTGASLVPLVSHATVLSSGIFAFAAAAFDRTQSVLPNISEPLIRPRQSNGALARLSLLPSSNPSSEPTNTNKNNQLKRRWI